VNEPQQLLLDENTQRAGRKSGALSRFGERDSQNGVVGMSAIVFTGQDWDHQ